MRTQDIYCLLMGMLLVALSQSTVNSEIIGTTSCTSGSATFSESKNNRSPSTLETPPQPSGHDRMLSILRELMETKDSLPFFGSAKTRSQEERLNGLNTNSPLRERVFLNYGVGMGKVQSGDIESGIENIKRALELTPASKKQLLLEFKLVLAVAYMRLGESQNCAQMNSPESCIVPIEGGGVHALPAGSRNAIPYLLDVLHNAQEDARQSLTARWLLNIAHMTLDTYPDGVPVRYRIQPSTFTSSIKFPRFVNVAPRVGLSTFSQSGGAMIDDLDNDGYLDVMVSHSDPAGQLLYYRNNGDGTFSNVTAQAGLTGFFGGLNLLQSDYNNDGHLDILILRGAWFLSQGRMPNSLLRNNGDGSFTDVTFKTGLGEAHFPTQTASWADYDNDGDLDLFVGNEAVTTTGPDGDPIKADVLEPCQLFRNNGNATFTDVAAPAGVAYMGYPKGVVWGDYDGDRFPDLFISEYYGPNVLYQNNGDGTFTDVAAKLGVTKPITSFPAWFWDFDNDGVLDLFVSSYDGRVGHVAAHYAGVQTPHEIAGHYQGDGKGGFTNMAREHALAYPMLPMGANFGDLNGDGFLDFYLGTGDPALRSLMPNVMFLNQKGKGFADVTMAGGFGHLQKGHGVAFADLDNDGDLDVFEQMGGAYPGDKFADVLYENPGFDVHWISIQLVGTKSNRAAIGARIRLRIRKDGDERSIYRHVNSGGSFGANPLRQTIGLGSASTIIAIEVYWPTTDLTQAFYDVAVDQSIRIVEGTSEYEPLALASFRLGDY